MADMFDSKEFVLSTAALLADRGGAETIAIDVGGISSIADYFVISTVRSAAQLRGLLDEIGEHCYRHSVEAKNVKQRPTEAGWTVVDCGFLVIHLMTAALREFYEIERLWFSGSVVFDDSPGTDSGSDAGRTGQSSSSKSS